MKVEEVKMKNGNSSRELWLQRLCALATWCLSFGPINLNQGETRLIKHFLKKMYVSPN